VGATIIGATTLAQLKENIDAAAIVLPEEVVKAIDAIHGRITNPGQ
jgi:aryl-alcohol dehydrogenase-like predicted oxidoreductase